MRSTVADEQIGRHPTQGDDEVATRRCRGDADLKVVVCLRRMKAAAASPRARPSVRGPNDECQARVQSSRARAATTALGESGSSHFSRSAPSPAARQACRATENGDSNSCCVERLTEDRVVWAEPILTNLSSGGRTAADPEGCSQQAPGSTARTVASSPRCTSRPQPPARLRLHPVRHAFAPSQDPRLPSPHGLDRLQSAAVPREASAQAQPQRRACGSGRGGLWCGRAGGCGRCGRGWK